MAAPLDRDEYDRWAAQAERAVVTARLAAAGGQHDWACFLAEQAAQLLVKGLLHGSGGDAWGHDLVRLVARAELGEVAAAAARLSRHYIPTRYPDAHASGAPGEHYTADDSAAALADVGVIAAAVAARWAELEGDA